VGESVKSPAGREKVREVAEVIGDDRATARVLSYFETGDEAMTSEDGESTYVVASFDPDADDGAAVERLQKEFADAEGITLGGGAVVGPQVGRIVGEDLARAEMLAFPILFVLLLWIFRDLVAALLPETALLLAASPRSILRLLRFMAGVSRLHPAQPYWYLELVGVEPTAQGLGVGTRLLEPVLARADEAGQRCYLETMTERNVAWYGTLGFEVVRAGVSFSPGGPPNWTMLRHPRQR
jgi:GNAT superfamily N-acetyltransferase